MNEQRFKGKGVTNDLGAVGHINKKGNIPYTSSKGLHEAKQR